MPAPGAKESLSDTAFTPHCNAMTKAADIRDVPMISTPNARRRFHYDDKLARLAGQPTLVPITVAFARFRLSTERVDARRDMKQPLLIASR